MLSLTAVSTTSPFSSPLKLLRRNTRVSKLLCFSSPTVDWNPDPDPSPQSVRGNHAGLRFEASVDSGSGKARIDSWIASRIQGVSRARVESSIRSGLVAVNGITIHKVSHRIKEGDKVSCIVSELRALRAEPEDIPLDIVYEDAHVLVVNKPANMVVHPAPGNANGTLVNAVLNHCKLPMVACSNNKRSTETEEYIETSESEIEGFFIEESSVEEFKSENNDALVRPGIVHRLDKGTSGLLVIAKDEHSHSHLAEQFKKHTIQRVYISLTSGVPYPGSGRIEIPIARDSTNRIRMAAVPGLKNSKHARYAASRYKVVEIFADGGSALVQWRLETGRTHQEVVSVPAWEMAMDEETRTLVSCATKDLIRVHAKYLGVPLLGDELYGGTKGMALSLLKPRLPSSSHGRLSHVISILQRPCLHALSLGFTHPRTGECLKFSCPPPDDFSEVLSLLRSFSHRSVVSADMEIDV